MDQGEVSEAYLLQIRREKTARELDRIRNSYSFRIGQIIATCLRFPPLLLILPIWGLWFTFLYGLERLGLKASHQHSSGRSIENPKRCIVFFPTNGVGLGHFTRLFAVAKRVRKQDPDVEVVFVTTMAALHLLESEGFPAYHLPGSYMFNDMTSSEWNAITEEMLAMVFEVHRPSVFVYDGAFPYRGMLNAIKNRTGLTNVWVRRGAFKKDGTKIPVDSIEHFQHIIRPGDSVSTSEKEVDFETPLHHVEPILLATQSDLFESEEVRSRFGIPRDAVAVYLQLGAGKINEIESDLQRSINLLNAYENVYIVVGESIIGERLRLKGDRLHIIRDYPNSMMFNGFDFAIMAGGYNSYQEALTFNLPTVFIPNKNTGMDDQSSRVSAGVKAGACLMVEEGNYAQLEEAIHIMMNDEKRRKMKMASEKTNPTGAEEIGRMLVGWL
jgi:UDP-N-acetylglucosamine--N-acetylmuramyl-(pentapeptide) pyrophosphoryl-undecaprenol N-acetylglucosamine transferase